MDLKNHLTVDRTPVLAATGVMNLRLTVSSTASGRVLYAPTAESLGRYNHLEAGESIAEFGSWPQVWLKTAWGQADVSVWSGVGFFSKSGSPQIGTTFKGGPLVELPADGTVVQLSTTVVGVHAIDVVQDPRNRSDSIVWLTTHVDLASDQKDPNGKPKPGSGPPRGGADKRFPLLYGHPFRIERFNSALWAWAEPGQRGPISVFYGKHGFGV